MIITSKNLEELKKDFKLLSEDNIGEFAYLLRDGRTKERVGILTIFDDEIGNKWISILEVKDRYQNKGIGKRLVDHAKEISCNAVAARKDNKKAINLYLNCGFKEDKDNKLQIKDSNYVGFILE